MCTHLFTFLQTALTMTNTVSIAHTCCIKITAFCLTALCKQLSLFKYGFRMETEITVFTTHAAVFDKNGFF